MFFPATTFFPFPPIHITLYQGLWWGYESHLAIARSSCTNRENASVQEKSKDFEGQTRKICKT